uniref:class II fructose-bisphosphate aldolase n=1 Tax=Streptobacillus moniliformis TaxID=34105 RepID=UPI000AC7C9E0
MKYTYKELGLVNTKDMFAKANREGYSVPAFNFNNLEQLQAIVDACVEMGSPVILQVSKGARRSIGQEMLPFL